MALLTGDSLTAELQRKKNLGIQPTSAANKSAYDKLSPTTTSTTPTNTTNYGTGVRKYFNDAGYTDVTYDKPSNTVRVNGIDAISPTKVVNGTSYANSSDLESALSRLQNRESTNKINDLLGRVETAINTPYKAPEFSYDIESDPQYQAALRRAQANAETASGNAMAELNKRGILNSTITSDRLGQIQQSEYGRVSDELVPQLMAQAYNRYRDSVDDGYRASRDNISDLASLLGLTSDQNQRQRDNAYRDQTTSFDQGMQNKQLNINTALAYGDRAGQVLTPQTDPTGYLRQINTGVSSSGTPISQTLDNQQFQYGKTQDAIKNALQARQVNASIANMSADNARQMDNTAYNRFMDMWQITGKAPDDMPAYGIKKGDPYPTTTSSAKSSINAKDSANNLSQAKGYIDSLNKDDAMAYAQGIADYLTDSDYRALLNYIDDNL